MSIFSSIASALGSGAGEAVTKTASGIADVVERWAPGDEKKTQMTVELNKLVETARAYDPRSTATGKCAEFINVLVDSFTRLIRPALTVAIFGGFFGWWKLGAASDDPTIVAWGYDLMAFWFGSRTVFSDIPKLVATLKAIRK
jgi:hypothetical protein